MNFFNLIWIFVPCDPSPNFNCPNINMVSWPCLSLPSLSHLSLSLSLSQFIAIPIKKLRRVHCEEWEKNNQILHKITENDLCAWDLPNLDLLDLF